MNVDLPQPDGPISAVTRFLGTSSEACLSARKFPYQMFRSEIWSFALGISADGSGPVSAD